MATLYSSYDGHRQGPANNGFGPVYAGVVLVVVVLWALIAVVLLTGTLINARQIESRVKQVNAAVDPIQGHTAQINLAKRTVVLTSEIKAAANPLSGQLQQVIVAAGNIDRHVVSILSHAQAIGGVVATIGSTVQAIGSNVQGIGSSVASISHSVSSINSSVNGIHSDVSTVYGNVGQFNAGTSISTDVNGISGTLDHVLPVATSIRNGIIGINNRAVTILSEVKLIHSDFVQILSGVGTAVGTPTILGHANSIDCSKIINLLGKTSGCGA
jgi:hypothetical protein